MLEFIKDVETDQLRWDHAKGADLALQSFPHASYYVWKIGQMSQIRDIGKSLFIEMFYKTILSKFSGIDAAKADEPIEKYGEDCLLAIRNLKLIVDRVVIPM